MYLKRSAVYSGDVLGAWYTLHGSEVKVEMLNILGRPIPGNLIIIRKHNNHFSACMPLSRQWCKKVTVIVSVS